MLCADTPTFRAQPTWLACSTFCLAILKMPYAFRHGFQNIHHAHHTQHPPSPKQWDSFNYWSNTPKFTVSFLKAMYGDAAKKENDWAFHYLPKIDRKYSWVENWDDMYRATVKGLLAFGMNGVPSAPTRRRTSMP